jgi:hypothetical protein
MIYREGTLRYIAKFIVPARERAVCHTEALWG